MASIWRPVDFEHNTEPERRAQGTYIYTLSEYTNFGIVILGQLLKFYQQIYMNTCYRQRSHFSDTFLKWEVYFFSKTCHRTPEEKKQRRCIVTAAEEEIVHQAYQLFADSGWENVLENIEEQVTGAMVGNWLQNEKIKEYYLSAGNNSRLSDMVRSNLCGCPTNFTL